MSQKQIAKRLGVSVALVSRVLSGKAAAIGVAPRTIERVQRVAAEMGYVPSAAALSLKGKATRTLGVVVSDYQDPFLGPMMKELQLQALERGYSLIMTGFQGPHPTDLELEPLHKHGIEGLIILGSEWRAVWLLSFGNLPVARIGHGNLAESSVRVTVDEHDAARRLVGHLMEQDYRRIFFVGEPLPEHQLRYMALEKAAHEYGCGLCPMFVDASDINAGVQGARRLIWGDVTADGIICARDIIAMGALHAFYDAGWAVPERVAVTGYNDIRGAAQFIPAVTTIQFPVEEMVAAAFDAVVSPSGRADITLPVRLVVRKST